MSRGIKGLLPVAWLLPLWLGACASSPQNGASSPTQAQPTQETEQALVPLAPRQVGSVTFSEASTPARARSPARPGEPHVVLPCRLPPLAGAATARVFAAGGYKGRELDFQIDQSRHSATQFEVLVNSPDAPVVLLLGAYEPSFWNLSWTPGTDILAVVASGYHRQIVLGIDASTPVLLSSQDDGPCDYFYVGRDGNSRINPLAQTLLGRPVDLVYAADAAGRVVIGEIPAPRTRIRQSRGRSAASYRLDNP